MVNSASNSEGGEMDGIHDLGGRQGFGRVRFTEGATAVSVNDAPHA